MSIRYDDMCRQLPCKTFLQTGACPYRDRCQYLHDPRLLGVSSKAKTRRKNVISPTDIVDSFFWPPMSSDRLRMNANDINSRSSGTPAAGRASASTPP